MPSIIKSTIIFSGPDHGWSESWYQNRGDNALLGAIADLYILGPKRADLLGNGYRIKGFRVAKITDNAGNRVRGEAETVLRTYSSSLNIDGAANNLSLLTIAKGADATKRKQTFMRGIWDSISDEEGTYNPNAGNWATYFAAWRASLLQLQYGWYGRTQAAPVYAVTNYTQTAGTYVDFTLAGNPFGNNELNIPQQVIFKGINTKSALNGSHVIVPLTANTCRTSKPIAVAPFVVGGTMRKFTYSFIQATNVRDERIVTRKTGAPLLASRGRSRVQVRV